jgi:hypothetical protein
MFLAKTASLEQHAEDLAIGLADIRQIVPYPSPRHHPHLGRVKFIDGLLVGIGYTILKLQ